MTSPIFDLARQSGAEHDTRFLGNPADHRWIFTDEQLDMLGRLLARAAADMLHEMSQKDLFANPQPNIDAIYQWLGSPPAPNPKNRGMSPMK